MRAVNIKWDIDYDENGVLPTEIEIPKNINDINKITDYLSDHTEYCFDGYDLIDAYVYDIFIDDLDGKNLVGDSGDWYFHDEETAKKDAEDYIQKHLINEYGVLKNVFHIKVYAI